MPPDIWLPGYKRVDLGLRVAGGPYDDTSRPKLGWHTTEGGSIAGARSAFRAYPPHLCYDPVTDTAEQYVALNRHAYAFAGGESDDEYIVQVEVVGFAAESHTWSDLICERLYRRVVAPIEATVGVPRQALRFRGQGEGIVLASPRSPIRLTLDGLRAYSGHLGHQHMPAPDGHWDPGALPIDRILAHAATPTPTEDDMQLRELIEYRTRQADGKERSLFDAAAAQSTWMITLHGKVDGLIKAVAAIAADPDITADQLAAVVDQAVAEHMPTAEQLAAEQLPRIEEVVTRVLGQDNAGQAAEILRQIGEQLSRDPA